VKLGRVVGNVVATVKHPALFAQRLLLVDFEGPGGKLAGRPQLALDVVDAGEGDRVLVLDEGNGAAQVLKRGRGPVRTVIVGVVDEVEEYPQG
jgi:microcompartment protein CcmK/EutM